MRIKRFLTLILTIYIFPQLVFSLDERAQIDLDTTYEEFQQQTIERQQTTIENGNLIREVEEQGAPVFHQPYIRYYSSFERERRLEDMVVAGNIGARNVFDVQEELYEAYFQGYYFTGRINPEDLERQNRLYYKVYYDGLDRIYRWEELSNGNQGVVRYCQFIYDDMNFLRSVKEYERRRNSFVTAANPVYSIVLVQEDTITLYNYGNIPINDYDDGTLSHALIEKYYPEEQETKEIFLFYSVDGLLMQVVEYSDPFITTTINYYYNQVGQLITKEAYNNVSDDEMYYNVSRDSNVTINLSLLYYYEYSYNSANSLTAKIMYDSSGYVFRSYYY